MLIEKFEEQVRKTPGKTAVDTGTETYSYEELNRRANGVARMIENRRPENAGSETVGLLFGHDAGMIVAILGALKAGKTYVALSPDYPENRLAYLLENSGASLMVTGSGYEKIAAQTALRTGIDSLDIDAPGNNNVSGENRPGTADPGKTAYIIYTSGSTGKPKGVCQNHKNVWYYVRNWIERFSITAADNMTLLTSLSHDGAVQDIFAALLTGATLCPYNVKNKETAADTDLSEFLTHREITLWHSVPPVFDYFAGGLAGDRTFPRVRVVALGGSPVREHHLDLAAAHFPNAEAANVYGQTESSVNSIWRLRPGETFKKVTLGQPLDNTKLMLVNDRGKKAAPFETGEILVACPHLSPGYWNDEEAGKKTFSRDPKFGRLYWTGDRGRLLLDGTIEFIGRKDAQVKVRGYRIETGEIEAFLLNHPFVKGAAVTAKTDDAGEQYLAAYFTGEGETVPPKAPELRRSLAKDLPDYMLPAYFVYLERFPLTPSNKIDRNALPEPEIEREDNYTAPRDEIERKLVDTWAGVLGREPDHVSRLKNSIGIDDNFFEIGGHSLKATVLAARIHREFHVKIPLAQIFRFPDIRGLAGLIGENRTERYTAVGPAEKREYYPLSSAQKRLFFLEQLENAGAGYHLPSVFNVRGNLDKKKLETVFNTLIARYETFRTSFHLHRDEPVQRIHDHVEFEIEEYAPRSAEDLVKEFIRPFDLSEAPLLRAGLARCAENEYLFLFDMHHIVSDGTSRGILKDNFIRLLDGGLLPPLALQYKDFALWQNHRIETGAAEEQERYWMDLFAGDGSGGIPRLNMPTDYPRPPFFSFEGEIFSSVLDTGVSRRFKELSAARGVTLYMNLLAAFNVLLYKYTGQEDIVVGSVIAGRSHADLQDIIGMFVNTLAMRNYPAGEKTYLEFLKEVKQTCIDASENQDVPFEDLVDKLKVERDPSRNPVFDVTLGVRNFETPVTASRKGFIFSPCFFDKSTSQFDLSVDAFESGDDIHISLQYCKGLFKRETVLRLKDHFVNVIKGVCKSPAGKLSGIDILTPGEMKEILHVFNDTARDVPRDKTLHRLFEEQVVRSPDRVALHMSNKTHMTYNELNKRSGQLASLLREKGAGPGAVVGIATQRSPEMMTGIFAVIKAGGAYMPIDPGYPEERIRYMLADSGARVLLSETGEKSWDIEVIALDNIPGNPPAPPTPPTPPTHPCYVIYTSGTTGRPKGVVIEHRSLVNRLNWMQKTYPLDRDDTILHKTPFTFDVSVWEIFWWAMVGASVNLLVPGGEKDPAAIVKAVEEGGVTVMHFVPSMLGVFLDYLEAGDVDTKRLASLKQVIASGEALGLSHVKRFESLLFSGNRTRLANLYGPTEATIDVSFYDCFQGEETGPIPIGKPIDNTRLVVLDRYGRLQPVGIPGELHIAGDGLARGYLNRPELTAERFGKNRSYKTYRSYRTYYKTGDLARWHDDGNLEFLGRIDLQVKIRGFRIELEEIENRLLEHNHIKEAAVVVIDREDQWGDKVLAAYFVSDNQLPGDELREYLLAALPGYMVPPYIVRLETMPLTASGKIDRSALPSPVPDTPGEYAAPRDPVEKKLVETWSELLGVEQPAIGIDTGFFNLGGHSLKLTILLGRIHREFDVKIPLEEAFKTPTVRALARYIKNAAKEKSIPVETVEKKEYYPLSSSQKRMYILQRVEGETTGHNLPAVMYLDGDLDKERLEKTLRRLIARHESFRTSFEMIGDRPVQRIHETVEFEIEYYGPGISPEEFRAGTLRDFIRPFDLSRAPLLRVGLVELDKSRHILVKDFHHIVYDGSSLVIFYRDFLKLYNGKALPPIRVQYKDYSQWQAGPAVREIIKKQEVYWLKEFGGEIPVLGLPADYSRPAVQGYEGSAAAFEIGEEETNALGALALKEECTLFILLLTAYNILLSRLSGGEDIVVGTPSAGRGHPDVQDIVGIFLNTLALRNRPSAGKTFLEFLREVKERTLTALENQDYQFEDIVDNVVVNRDLSRHPLFDTMLVLHTELDTARNKIPAEEQIDLNVKPFEFEEQVSEFDLTLVGFEKTGTLGLKFQYSTKLFKKETVERWVRYFKNILSGIIDEPGAILSRLEIVPEEEKKRVLHEFNRTAADFPTGKTIPLLFEEQAARTPDLVALVEAAAGETQKMTYRELNEKSDGLAYGLRLKGAKPGTVVAVMGKGSVRLMVGLLGILKAGAAYLPLDPGYPAARLTYILRQADTPILLTREKPSEIRKKLSFEGDIAGFPGETPCEYRPTRGNIARAQDPAYVIYTSGTTGAPKGVLVRHRNAVNFITWITAAIPFSAGKTISAVTTISFDIFFVETLLPVTRGLTVVLGGENEQKDPRLPANLILTHGVDIVQVTPSRLRLLISTPGGRHCLGRVSELIVCGEAFPPNLLDDVKKVFTGRLYNGYGPTEATIFASVKDFSRSASPDPTIGTPIANTRIYILNPDTRVQPVGVPGELFIGGGGVAAGYLNNVELTAEKFIESPFIPGDRLYRTGDLARWLPNGEIEFLGRMDHQVKIRGFRIELEEIEEQLLAREEIEEAVVVSKNDRGGDNYLAAYIVPSSRGDTGFPGISALREYLAQRLPGYMLPAYFIPLETLPLTPNGKIDRKALPDPGRDRPELKETFAEAGTVLEKTIAAAWKDVLKLDNVGIDDNFFELGGNSLAVVALNSRLEETLGEDIPVVAMFRYRTVRSFIRYLKKEVDAGELTGDRSGALEKGEARKRKKMQMRRKGTQRI